MILSAPKTRIVQLLLLIRIMKMSVLILLLFIVELSCLEVYYDDLTYFPKDSNDIINYRYMKLTRSRDKTLIYFRGNFTVLTDLGNQKLVVLELHNENAMMVRSVKPFCVFVKEETIFWPSLIKSSNMPKDNPCPFPAVSCIFFKLFIDLILNSHLIRDVIDFKSFHCLFPKA
ncbi:hypothetical protein ACKWTF_013010 [Chironomus riparius]